MFHEVFHMADDAIHIRVSPSLKKQILDLIEEGEYRDVTDFVTKAIRNQLDNEPFEKYDKIKAAFEAVIEDRDDDFIRDIIHNVIEADFKLNFTRMLDDKEIQERIRKIKN